MKMIREYANLYHPKDLNPDVLKLLKQQQTVLEDSQKKLAQQQKELQDKIAFLENSNHHLELSKNESFQLRIEMILKKRFVYKISLQHVFYVR
ncbi:hypothetical protein [Pseudogracilibacillus sp. SO30301A]|uniref:hypothetical protein n=1 Tax=Pseudogracilibacillus sp. SO30301A TaxID=3098291 RepID=UPI00300E42B6